MHYQALRARLCLDQEDEQNVSSLGLPRLLRIHESSSTPNTVILLAKDCEECETGLKLLSASWPPITAGRLTPRLDGNRRTSAWWRVKGIDLIPSLTMDSSAASYNRRGHRITSNIHYFKTPSRLWSATLWHVCPWTSRTCGFDSVLFVLLFSLSSLGLNYIAINEWES